MDESFAEILLGILIGTLWGALIGFVGSVFTYLFRNLGSKRKNKKPDDQEDGEE